MTEISEQPENRIPGSTDLLSPNKFKIVIGRFPKVDFFTQRVPLPTITLGRTIKTTNREVDIKYPGDKLEYEDLIVSILIDEGLEGYEEIHKWMNEAALAEDDNDFFSDMSILVLTNNSNKNKTFTFHNCFPQTIGNILFDTTATEDQPLSVDVIFNFSHFTIT